MDFRVLYDALRIVLLSWREIYVEEAVMYTARIAKTRLLEDTLG